MTPESHPRAFGIIEGFDPFAMTDEDRARLCTACGGDHSVDCRHCGGSGVRPLPFVPEPGGGTAPKAGVAVGQGQEGAA